MYLSPWSLALTLVSLLVLFLAGVATRTGIRVLRYWEPESDSRRQILLESETWLASTLVEYGLGFQIVSLGLFVLAADQYCQVIPGAMCATGALLANSYGVPTLAVKIAGVFLGGFWIVLHQLDIRSESRPLVKTKFVFLLLLLPLLLTGAVLQILYIGGLQPDIITSCCAVVFSTAAGADRNLLEGWSQATMLRLFYGTAAMLIIIGVLLWRRWRPTLGRLFAGIWLWFFVLALVAVTSVFSSYIYAMPFHHCPFCIMKPEYNYIGFGLFGTLIGAVFFGLTPAAVDFLKNRPGLAGPVASCQRLATRGSLVLLFLFTLLASYHYLLYRFFGGEI